MPSGVQVVEAKSKVSSPDSRTCGVRALRPSKTAPARQPSEWHPAISPAPLAASRLPGRPATPATPELALPWRLSAVPRLRHPTRSAHPPPAYRAPQLAARRSPQGGARRRPALQSHASAVPLRRRGNASPVAHRRARRLGLRGGLQAAPSPTHPPHRPAATVNARPSTHTHVGPSRALRSPRSAACRRPAPMFCASCSSHTWRG